MYIVGLTGGIASGKSTVSALLEQRGAGIIDADRIGHEVILRGTEGYSQLLGAFGRDILGVDGEISRPRLAGKVFGDADRVALLNSITHPLIGGEIFRRMEHYRRERGEGTIVVLDAALLIESAPRDLVDFLVVVAADPAVQVERLGRDRSMPEEEAQRRISAQMGLEEKKSRADWVIENEGSLDELAEEVEALWKEISARAESKTSGGGA